MNSLSKDKFHILDSTLTIKIKKVTKKDIDSIIALISQYDISTLILDSCGLTSTTIKFLSPVFDKITHLELAGNVIKDTGFLSILKMVSNTKLLKYLDVWDNYISLCNCPCSLNGLDLSSLEHLILSDNCIESKELEKLQVSNLSSLNLRNNSLTDIKAIFNNIINNNNTLTDLDISGNNFRDKEMTIDVNIQNNMLRKLTMENNNINDSMFKDLLGIIPCIENLSELNLYGNDVGDEDALQLFKFCAGKSDILDIDLSANNIDNDGFRYLNCLSHPLINKIDLRDNPCNCE